MDSNSPGTAAQMSDGGYGARYDLNHRNIYDPSIAGSDDWGYVGESYNDGTYAAEGKPPFFRDIKIYGLNQHKFVS